MWLRSNKGTSTQARRHEDGATVPSSLRASVPRAFSLIEIMIVVVIIGLLAGLVTYATTGYLDRAKRQRAQADIATLSGAVDSFYLDHGRFPDNNETLRVLVPQFVKSCRTIRGAGLISTCSRARRGSTTSSATAPTAAKAAAARMRTLQFRHRTADGRAVEEESVNP